MSFTTVSSATTKAIPTFARHETFHPRYGWLKKGFDEASYDREIFLREDASVRLGVGKNMVRSIRYWCHAFQLLEPPKEGKSKARLSQPTEFGNNLLADRGWDPFLEDPASLWWLHWKLLQFRDRATAWYFAFHVFRQVNFSPDDLLGELDEYQKTVFKKQTAISSLKKDISCLIRMYSPTFIDSGVLEDSINSPFSEIGLLDTGTSSKTYSFRVGEKETLPAEIVVAACLEFASSRGSQKTIALSSLAYEAGGPGLAFKLPETAIGDSIEQVSQDFDRIGISDTAGLVQFYFQADNPLDLAKEILQTYYSKHGKIA